jgi:hypothetical protein
MPGDGKGAKGGDVMTKTHATGAALSYGQRYLAECVAAGGKGITRRKYMVRLVSERLTGLPQEDGYQSSAMIAGTLNEPMARLAYEAETGELVREAGFAYLPIPAGCSVDGFIGDDGIQEIKCPEPHIHVDYLERMRVPPDYVPQVTHNMWVTGAAFVDFVSYCPSMPEDLQLVVVRAGREEFDIKGHEEAVLRFLAETQAMEDRLRGYTLRKAA